jgi:hypothetical protein
MDADVFPDGTDYAVCYKFHDLDRRLFVVRAADTRRGDVAVKFGSERTCREYVTRHQGDEQ